MLILIQAGVSCKWANDSQHLLLGYFDEIHDSPSQVYHTALPFCPSSSWLHKHYATELSQEAGVVQGLPTEWRLCTRTVTSGHQSIGLTCWKDIIAVGLDSGDIVTLDGITGIQTTTLSGHNAQVGSLAFSPDGMLLASGSNDRTIKLWDVQTGVVVKTFQYHTNCIWSVSISADCTMIASGSDDNTIRLWIIQTGGCHRVIHQRDWVKHVRFSPIDPQHLMSVSGNKVHQWDTNGQKINPTYNGSNIAFSPDGTQFVMCQGETIAVQTTNSGVIVAQFHMANGTISHSCFSPDGKLIAAAVDSTVYVWDTTSSAPHPIKTLVGHTDDIDFLAFSFHSSLISSSKDKSVKFWQIGTPLTDPVVTITAGLAILPAPNNTPIQALQPMAGHLTSNSSTLVNPGVSACRRLISRAFSPHEIVSLIEEIFTRPGEVNMIRCLDRDAAQAFIDVVHEVCFIVLHAHGMA